MDSSTYGLYGPPQRVAARRYPSELEIIETRSNNILIADYKQDIKQFMARLECNNDINPAMIDLQPEIQWFMRPFLLDYIIELHSSFRLQAQTLFRCFNIVDRYCAKRIVFKRHYQLVGCTALWIAAKYEDKKSRVPTLKELAMMCRDAYDEEMFIQMERHVLATLDWSLERPTLEDCLQLSIELCITNEDSTPIRKSKSFSSPTSLTSAATAISRFLCELSLYHRDFLNYEASLVSSAATLLACSMLQIPHGGNFLRKLNNSIHSTLDVEDRENIQPQILGLFLSGFDELTLAKVRKLALMFSCRLEQASDVLVTKYKALGVILVTQNFVQRNFACLQKLSSHEEEVGQLDDNLLHDSQFSVVADILLSIHEPYEPQDSGPVTPPSTSRSVFSELPNSSPSFTTPTGYHLEKFGFTPERPSPILEISKH